MTHTKILLDFVVAQIRFSYGISNSKRMRHKEFYANRNNTKHSMSDGNQWHGIKGEIPSNF